MKKKKKKKKNDTQNILKNEKYYHYICTTGFNKIHNLCRDHYEITSPPLNCTRSDDFAHDLFCRHKKESADSFMIASPTNHALSSRRILTKSLSEFHFVLTYLARFSFSHKRPFLRHRQGALNRTRLHDHFSGDPFYTTIALQPIVSAATTISHTNTQRPHQKTTVVLFNAVVLGPQWFHLTALPGAQ